MVLCSLIFLSLHSTSISIMDSFNSRLSLIHLGYSKDNEKWNYGPLCSSFSRLYLVTRGAAKVVMNGVKHQLSPGHIYLIPELATHWDISNGCFEHYYIHFMDPTHQLMSLYHQYDLPFEMKTTPMIESIVRHISEEYREYALKESLPDTYDHLSSIMTMYNHFEKNSIGKKMKINSMLQYLLSIFFCNARRREAITDSRIASIVWHIEQHSNESIRLERLAEEVCICKESLIRLFRKQTGMTPIQYVMKYRVMRAETLLLQNNQTIKEVAMQVGYKDQNYFCRCFRKIVGMSPQEFIRQNR